MSTPSIADVRPSAVPRAQRRRTTADILRSDRAQALLRAPKDRLHRKRNEKVLRSITSPARLHIGCGLNTFDGWLNVDRNSASAADLHLDLRGGLPIKPGTVELAYSEHVIEHMSREVALGWLCDLRSALTAEGVVRIATPDLAYIVERYLGNWRDQAWLEELPPLAIAGPCEMVNVALRSWGHTYVYDFEDLRRLLLSAGFGTVRRVEWGESEHRDLCNREQRLDSKLIVEASS